MLTVIMLSVFKLLVLTLYVVMLIVILPNVERHKKGSESNAEKITLTQDAKRPVA
jgi:hypothetical protein